MKKKKHVLLLLLTIVPEMLSAQFVLKKELHLLRPGDEIIKQQLK
jgi:uncharacterized membrane-anchored protein